MIRIYLINLEEHPNRKWHNTTEQHRQHQSRKTSLRTSKFTTHRTSWCRCFMKEGAIFAIPSKQITSWFAFVVTVVVVIVVLEIPSETTSGGRRSHVYFNSLFLNLQTVYISCIALNERRMDRRRINKERRMTSDFDDD